MDDDEPIDESRFDKKRGRYTVRIERSDGNLTHYHISVQFDEALERLGVGVARDKSAQLLNAIKIGLGRHQIKAVSPPRHETAESIQLVSMEFAAPADMRPAEVYAAYEKAYEKASALLKVASNDTENRNYLALDAMKRGLGRHGITGEAADAIARDQLREMLEVVKIREKKDKPVREH